MDERLRQAIVERVEQGKLPCHQAHAIASELGIEPLEVGQAADEAGVRISRCQLGLFGYGSKANGTHKVARPMEEVPLHLEAALRGEADEEGLRCAAMWGIADRLGYRRLEVSNAAEGLALRVSHCQLGCFPRPKKGR